MYIEYNSNNFKALNHLNNSTSWVAWLFCNCLMILLLIIALGNRHSFQMYFTSFLAATSCFGVIRKLSKQGRKEGVCSEGPKNSTTFAKIVCLCLCVCVCKRERERERGESGERQNVKVEVKYGERKLETDNAEIG